MFGDILQPTHLIFIFVVALLVLGPKRLPEVGRSLGKGIRDFRGALSGLEEETSDVREAVTTPINTNPQPVTPATVVPESEPAGDAVATQVMAATSPAPDTMPLDPHAAETAAVDAAHVTAADTAAHAAAAETAAHPASPSVDAPATPDPTHT